MHSNLLERSCAWNGHGANFRFPKFAFFKRAQDEETVRLLRNELVRCIHYMRGLDSISHRGKRVAGLLKLSSIVNVGQAWNILNQENPWLKLGNHINEIEEQVAILSMSEPDPLEVFASLRESLIGGYRKRLTRR